MANSKLTETPTVPLVLSSAKRVPCRPLTARSAEATESTARAVFVLQPTSKTTNPTTVKDAEPIVSTASAMRTTALLARVTGSVHQPAVVQLENTMIYQAHCVE